MTNCDTKGFWLVYCENTGKVFDTRFLRQKDARSQAEMLAESNPENEYVLLAAYATICCPANKVRDFWTSLSFLPDQVDEV